MSKRIVVEVEGEGVVIQPESGQMFSLNETGLFVYRLLDQGQSVKEIARKLSKEYNVGQKEAMTDVTEFVRQLQEKGYLERINSSDRGKQRGNSTRLKLRMGAGKARGCTLRRPRQP